MDSWIIRLSRKNIKSLRLEVFYFSKNFFIERDTIMFRRTNKSNSSTYKNALKYTFIYHDIL